MDVPRLGNVKIGLQIYELPIVIYLFRLQVFGILSCVPHTIVVSIYYQARPILSRIKKVEVGPIVFYRNRTEYLVLLVEQLHKGCRVNSRDVKEYLSVLFQFLDLEVPLLPVGALTIDVDTRQRIHLKCVLTTCDPVLPRYDIVSHD